MFDFKIDIFPSNAALEGMVYIVCCFDTEKPHFLVLLGEMGITVVVLGNLHSHKAGRSSPRLLWRSSPKDGNVWSHICLLSHLIQKQFWGWLQAILLIPCSARCWG